MENSIDGEGVGQKKRKPKFNALCGPLRTNLGELWNKTKTYFRKEGVGNSQSVG